jgi:hypothetical protein
MFRNATPFSGCSFIVSLLMASVTTFAEPLEPGSSGMKSTPKSPWNNSV